MIAIPVLEWSVFFTYEEDRQSLIERLREGLSLKTDEAEALSMRIYQWTREM